MTITELSREFDVLYENISSNQAPGLDEYEKSVFLTTAQEEVLFNVYNGEGFESKEESRRYLSSLIKTARLKPFIKEKGKEDTYSTISNKSKVFKLPKDILFITYEAATTMNSTVPDNLEVIPTTQDEYHRVKKNPFRNNSKKRALRLDLEDNLVEIVSPYNLSGYTVRYVRKPSPIILYNDNTDLKIDGDSKHSLEELHPLLYRIILKRAVALAIAK